MKELLEEVLERVYKHGNLDSVRDEELIERIEFEINSEKLECPNCENLWNGRDCNYCGFDPSGFPE